MVRTRQIKEEWLMKSFKDYFGKYPTGAIDKEKLKAKFMLNFHSGLQNFNEIIKIFHSNGIITDAFGEIIKGENFEKWKNIMKTK